MKHSSSAIVDRKNILFPPLHITLGIMKYFVKTLSIEGVCFTFLISAFPSLSFEKLNAGVFDSPQIRQLVKDEHFIGTMTELQRNAGLAFKNTVKYFLGNTRAQNYTKIAQHLSESNKILGCNMIIKLQFLHSYVADFPKNLGAVRVEQGVRFHQYLKVMEALYQDRWDAHMMSNYCCSIKRECPRIKKHSRKVTSEHFDLNMYVCRLLHIFEHSQFYIISVLVMCRSLRYGSADPASQKDRPDPIPAKSNESADTDS
ncbi:hypothetical protein AVEN_141028-1 [Araneus ventricosus]|uniref:Uncharacterized protein n=1 Tax=Araneus ventricosus TaxID=182803 RepID=A0A4Y2Q7T9_ARAVE|nr:hypothetical protein AVEN_141028-1 [Araneus ventricosus]